ncbi:MAG TPA: hypothetical protein VGR62_03630 [Candidatus Binatia bacterium]|jgi:hypothetical protein|nr:hypothetical protein [Candidatus Binatia bacterium]
MRAPIIAVVLVAGLVAGTTSLAGTPPPRCPTGRFVVQGNPLLGFGAADSDAVVVGDTQVSTATGCAQVKARRLKGTRKGTKVVVTWTTGCGIWNGPIKLTAMIENGECRTMTGTFKYPRSSDGRKVTRVFTAVREVDGTCQDGGIDTFALIQRRIFYARGCNVSTCHGPYAQADLDLSQESAYLELVGVAANNATAHAAGKLRVAPGDALTSFLSQKLHGTQLAGEGSRMPLIGPQLPTDERALIDAWINAGAPQTGRVADAPCLPPNDYVPTAAPPVPPGGHQILLEGPWLQPGQEQEGCLWMKVPNNVDFTAGKWEFALNPGTHHFAIFPWTKPGTPTTGVWNATDIGCISGSDFGNTLSGAPQAPYFVATYPAGIGRVVEAGTYIGLNAHYRNYWQVPIQIKIWTNIHPYAGTPVHFGQTVVDYTDMFSISVPPNTQKIQPGRWVNDSSQVRYLYSVTGHMHQRGIRFTAKKSDGSVIYENFDYAHPIFREFVPPIVLNPGDWIDYECLHDNGVTKPVRKDASGNPTTLRFGVTTEDEMCTLNGEFYTN